MPGQYSSITIMSTIPNIWKNEKGFIWMLAIAIISLISSQLTEGVFHQGKLIFRMGFFLFMLITVNSSSLRPKGKLMGNAITSLMLLLTIIMAITETQWLNLLYSILATGCTVYIISLVVSQILANKIITTYKIAGGVAVYILIGHLWTSLYLTIYILQPDSFQYSGEQIQPNDALKHLSYFSFVTLTTIGYGDILSVGPVARILVMLEGLLSQLFPAIFIAKLVSQQIEDSRKK